MPFGHEPRAYPQATCRTRTVDCPAAPAVVGHALVARGADGYRAVFGLADVDPHFGHARLMVIWKNADGSPLAARSGPFELIVTGESRAARWVRQLEAIEVRNVP